MISHRIFTPVSRSPPCLSPRFRPPAWRPRSSRRGPSSGPRLPSGPSQVVRRPGPGRRGRRARSSRSCSRSCRRPSAGSCDRPVAAGNESYLATYPALAAFLKQHPEIRSSPGFFFEHIGPMEFWNPSQPETRESQAIRIWRDIIQFFAIAGVFLVVTGAFIWIIRTSSNTGGGTARQRSIPRCTTSCWIGSRPTRICWPTCRPRRAAGSSSRRRCRSRPPPRPVGAPFSRILWSVQVGVVLAAGGLGLLFVSGRVIEEVAQPLFAIGVLALAVGAGFVVSAGASFLLSRRLGLFEPPVPPREHIESAGAVTT